MTSFKKIIVPFSMPSFTQNILHYPIYEALTCFYVVVYFYLGAVWLIVNIKLSRISKCGKYVNLCILTSGFYLGLKKRVIKYKKRVILRW